MPLGLQKASLNFDLIKEIGAAGKNSKVYLANDHQLSSQIVIKKIDKTTLTYEGEFYKEAKILYNHEHANIARVNYGCEDDLFVYIAMPYYRNGSLKDLLDKRFLSVREIIRYSIQFLSGLSHIHANKLLHFDVKPDNIFLTDSDEAVLADFGLAKAMDIYNIAVQEYVYMKQVPPEAFKGLAQSFGFDIYLAGLTIYRLCNGAVNFDEQFIAISTSEEEYEQAVTTGQFPARDSYLYHIPPGLIKAINKSLSLEPSDRHKNALELINDLAAVNLYLDWKYEEDVNTKRWFIDKGDKRINIIVSKNGHDFDVTTRKAIISSGKESKVSEFCVTKIISKDLKKFVQKALKELS